jgi:hypothetical protein
LGCDWANDHAIYETKLFCYVDESGQDTKGQFFIVAVVIDEQPDNLRVVIERIEQTSRKGLRKWFHTNRERRLAYIRQIIESDLLRDTISYAHYTDTKAYADLTVLTTAKAILEKAGPDYEATVFIDGLSKTDQRKVADGLRKLQVQVRKVRGLADEADALIRLADALAGFIRDCLEGDQELLPLYQQALARRVVRELK